MFSESDWALVKDLFDRCLAADEDQAEGILTAAGVPDHVAAEVRRLLISDGQTEEDFLKPIPVVQDFYGGSRLREGDLLAGRFEIQRLLGSGGMGEVYAAHDLQNDRQLVAVKVMRVGLSVEQSSQLRFRREWEVASGIHHPNICQLGDLFENCARNRAGPGDITFFTMEFISGRTLDELLKEKGSLSFEATAAVALEILNGLSYIHSQGVVHRDLKPGNIMLREGANVVPPPACVAITDFGLARRETLPFSQKLSTAGAVMGTFKYLAPEQLRGESGTALSDIYTFGLILFEMLSGKLPFLSDSAESLFVRLKKPAPRLRTAGVPLRWAITIQACLEPKPGNRPQSADELIKLFTGEAGPQILLYTKVHRRAVLAASLALTSSAAGAAWWTTRLHAGHGVTLLVAQEPAGAQAAIAVQLREALARSSYFRLWSIENLQPTWSLMGRKSAPLPTTVDWRQIAFRQGVPLVVFVSVKQRNSTWYISARLEQISGTPEYPRKKWEHEFTAATDADVFTAVAKTADWVRGLIGEAQSDIDASRTPPEMVTTPSWRALVEYSAGEQALTASDYQTALLKYDAALRFDPGFTMAWMRKGDVDFRVSNEPEAYSAYEKAIESSNSRPLTRREDLRFRSMLLSDTGDYSGAEKLFAEYFHYFPNDGYGPFFRALPLLLMGYPEEAISCLKLAMQFPAMRDRAQTHLAFTYAANRQFNLAQEESDRLQKTSVRRAAWAEGILAYTKGATVQALSLLEEASKAPELLSPAYLRLNRVSVLAEAGQTQMALQEALRNAELNASDGQRSLRNFNLLSAAYLYYQSQDCDGALRTLDLLQPGQLGFFIIRHAGTLYARCGQLDKCRQLLDPVPVNSRFPRASITRLRLLGELDIASGHAIAGLVKMRQAAALDVRAYGKDYLAYALMKAGQTAKARAEYQACLKQKGFQLQIAEPEPAGYCFRAASQINS